MKNYKPILIAEIGLNYLGNKIILFKYINFLSKKKIDGISIQILKKSFYKRKYKNYKLEDKTIIEFINLAKKNFNYIGVATDDISLIPKLKKLGINFIKILSKDSKNLKLINKCKTEKIKNIFISTGYLSTLSSLKKLLKNIKFKKINLIYTNLKNKNTKTDLNQIRKIRESLNLQVSYGNHSVCLDAIPDSVFFLPKAIFFYVKLGGSDINFPDDKHAVKLGKIDTIIKKINKNLKML